MIKNKQNGFTLIELSIVLIIISLIVGGIVGGKSLIKSAGLKSIISDIHKYKTTVNTFELQYSALPGDINNATEYWPTECVDLGLNPCDGNGDGIMGNYLLESPRLWQHLALSSIIEGTYDGSTNGSPSNIEELNNTYPSGALESTYYIYNSNNSYNGKSGTILYISSNLISGGFVTINAPLLSSGDMKSIDKKMDEGHADAGYLRARSGSGVTNCLIGGGATGDYDLSTTTKACVMFYFF